MKIMILLAIVLTSISQSKYTIDFGEKKDGQDWMIVSGGKVADSEIAKARVWLPFPATVPSQPHTCFFCRPTR